MAVYGFNDCKSKVEVPTKAEHTQLKSDLTKCLPLKGGTLGGDLSTNNGNTKITNGGYGALLQHIPDPNDSTNFSYFGVKHNSENTGSALKFVQKVNNKNTAYNIFGSHSVTCGTTSLTAGTDALTNDYIYQMYE